ncbi:alpha/beta fold hydrolase [Aspergillus clavatus NRRL 1]|uniref:Alpha/beta hydrolase, putative n=1 Tax=Aspergillus clavatus (strain ATCC 1007 / CBS 513.65 / DSM 816 / NCTC 3887 / NRRL 1 / QM 1276 / 107) TaxID=344612 RepID=A1CCT4_ASPCL|nr:alpha/beta hydrolase, putative [Aspergillus clavatus NRRL 1]EAW12341.1 alpha/beta hydrolase, putative [Aspergillus clavatus NRRL 1]
MEGSTSKYTMISIGTHRLSFSTSGPPRSPSEPIVVFIPGAGDVASSYCAVERLVAAFSPLFLYDRSGLGRSEAGPHPPSATTAAKELHALLDAAKIHPPLILVGHSYGAIIAREYLHLHPTDVASMVLADASTERVPGLFRDPDLDIDAVLGGLSFAKVTGLRDTAQLSREEWRVRAMDIARGRTTWQAETKARDEVCATLGEKEQYRTQALGDRPLSVIRCHGSLDYGRVYEKGVEAGNGTAAQRRALRELLHGWDELDREMQEAQLQLSRTRIVANATGRVIVYKSEVDVFTQAWL